MALVIDVRVGQHRRAPSPQHAVRRRLSLGENCDDALGLDRRLRISKGVARRGAHGVGVDNVGENGVADPQISAGRLGIAEQKDLAILEFAAGGRVCDGGEEIHPLRNDRVAQFGFFDFPEPERNAERGRASRERLRAVRIAGDEFGAASVRVGNRGGRQKRAFDLDVVNVCGIGNAGFRLRAFDRGGDFANLRKRANFLRREITRHGHAEARAAFPAPSRKAHA